MFSAPELPYAAQMRLRSAGEQNAAQLFKVAMTTPSRASKMRRAWKVRQENVGIKSFTRKEAGLLVKEYPWYYMPAGVHKVLMHGAQESLHTKLKAYRERYSRKCSRISTTTDLIRSLLVSSDPFATDFRPMPRK
jgi:hypothetical protein